MGFFSLLLGLCHHPTEYRFALATACRVVMQVMAYLRLRTIAPPEHCHAEGTQVVGVGIMEQLGFAALASTRRWLAKDGVGKEFLQAASLSLMVEQLEIIE